MQTIAEKIIEIAFIFGVLVMVFIVGFRFGWMLKGKRIDGIIDSYVGKDAENDN